MRGDLLGAQCSLAHCVSSDFHMSAGVAREIKRIYGGQEVLRAGGWQIGDAARIEVEHGRYIFYLVTKLKYFHLPTLEDLTSSLVQLARWAELLRLSELAVPRLGCGLDKLHWASVREVIMRVFKHLDITIYVYYH